MGAVSLLVALAGLTAAPALAKGGGKPSSCASVSGPANVPCGRSGGGRTRAVPEPASWALMLLGAAGVGALARRRRAKGKAGSDLRSLGEGRN